MMCLSLNPNRNMPTTHVNPWVPGLMISSSDWISSTPGPKGRTQWSISSAGESLWVSSLFLLELLSLQCNFTCLASLGSHSNVWIKQERDSYLQFRRKQRQEKLKPRVWSLTQGDRHGPQPRADVSLLFCPLSHETTGEIRTSCM